MTTPADKTPPKAPSACACSCSAGQSAGASPKHLGELMAQAHAMEREAAERYAEFADTMETHNNPEVAALFRRMAEVEARHAEHIMTEMGWTAPPTPPQGGYGWPGLESPETVPVEEVHYLMTPWHALRLALAAEERAEQFFRRIAAQASNDTVRRAAQSLAAEEREHIALVTSWLARIPEPAPDWAVDPDPPRYTD